MSILTTAPRKALENRYSSQGHYLYTVVEFSYHTTQGWKPARVGVGHHVTRGLVPSILDGCDMTASEKEIKATALHLFKVATTNAAKPKRAQRVSRF